MGQVIVLPSCMISYLFSSADMERLRSQLALAAFLQEVGEAVEQAELVCIAQLLPQLHTRRA